MPKRSTQSSEEFEPKLKKVRFAVFSDAETFFILDNFAETFFRCKNKTERMHELKIFEPKMQRFQRSSPEIEGRLKNLKQQFNISEKEKNQGYAIKWKFFDRMRNILESAQEDKASIENHPSQHPINKIFVLPKRDQEGFYLCDSSPGSSGSTENAFVRCKDPAQINRSLASFDPPSCKYGPIARPKNPVKPLEVQHQQQVFMNYRPTPQYSSKPWKEMIDADSFISDYDCSFSDYDCSFSYDEAVFDLPSPVRKVKTYKSFTSYFKSSPQRSSTPIYQNQLIADFKDKCSLVESMSCSTGSSSSECSMYMKENMKPAVEKQRKSTLRKKEHEGCSFCRQSGQHYRVTASHTLKDSKDRVLCPFLRTQVCTLCMADGDVAHVFDDCPLRAFVKLPSRISENQKVGSNKVYRRLNF